jgi:hypothetical protein
MIQGCNDFTVCTYNAWLCYLDGNAIPPHHCWCGLFAGIRSNPVETIRHPATLI